MLHVPNDNTSWHSLFTCIHPWDLHCDLVKNLITKVWPHYMVQDSIHHATNNNTSPKLKPYQYIARMGNEMWHYLFLQRGPNPTLVFMLHNIVLNTTLHDHHGRYFGMTNMSNSQAPNIWTSDNNAHISSSQWQGVWMRCITTQATVKHRKHVHHSLPHLNLQQQNVFRKHVHFSPYKTQQIGSPSQHDQTNCN